jgi:hypothetical protein
MLGLSAPRALILVRVGHLLPVASLNSHLKAHSYFCRRERAVGIAVKNPEQVNKAQLGAKEETATISMSQCSRPFKRGASSSA